MKWIHFDIGDKVSINLDNVRNFRLYSPVENYKTPVLFITYINEEEEILYEGNHAKTIYQQLIEAIKGE